MICGRAKKHFSTPSKSLLLASQIIPNTFTKVWALGCSVHCSEHHQFSTFLFHPSFLASSSVQSYNV
uniref:Uncharacterized protein n=1 Tax=Pygocentrus nattereri TaxID=42514 RepID=A0A3B4ER96_PYGNA